LDFEKIEETGETSTHNLKEKKNKKTKPKKQYYWGPYVVLHGAIELTFIFDILTISLAQPTDQLIPFSTQPSNSRQTTKGRKMLLLKSIMIREKRGIFHDSFVSLWLSAM